MIFTVININRPYGAMYSQTVYVPNIRSGARGFCDCWNLTFYAVNI